MTRAIVTSGYENILVVPCDVAWGGAATVLYAMGGSLAISSSILHGLDH